MIDLSLNTLNIICRTVACPEKVRWGAQSNFQTCDHQNTFNLILTRRKKRGGGGQGGHVPPLFYWGGGGGNGMFVPPLLNPHFYFPLELYLYITLTNNYLAFFIYQLIILWTIAIN